MLILYHCVGLFLTFQLTQSYERVVELGRTPKTGSQTADLVRAFQGRMSWLITPLLAVTLYLSFWLLDKDHQRLRSFWSLGTLLITLGVLGLDLKLRRLLSAFQGGVGSDTGARSLPHLPRAFFAMSLLLSLTYWGLQI